MTGSIFVLDNNGAIELKESKFDNEAIFQELIEKYPNILAGDQITPEAPRKWIFISREMGVPSEKEGSNQWFLDHLFIDQDSIPTFVEVKRSSDTRIRREVVAQMLDYAANATEYWPVDTIRNIYEKNGTNTFDDLNIDIDKEDLFWENVHTNLRAGKIRLLFVADEIPLSLRRIIEFLNSQMTETEVLGVEIKQYVSKGDIKTIVPKVIGQTVNSYTVKNRARVQWDEDSFMESVEQLNGKDAVRVCTDILRAFEDMGCRIWWGKGKTHGSFVPVFDGKNSHQFISLYPFTKNTLIEVQFQYLKEPLNSLEKRKEIQAKLEAIDNRIVISDERLYKRPSFDWSVLREKEKLNHFVNIFKEMIQEIKKFEKNIDAIGAE